MITIIAATNRIGSNTRKVASQYQAIFKEKGEETVFLSLEELTGLHRDDNFNRIETEILVPSDKFVFVMPEYNGSIPGILKLLIDISDVKRCWAGKKSMMVGVANGRAGNLRGMDHLTNIMNHMLSNVLPLKLPLSQVSSMMDEHGVINNPGTVAVMNKQVEDFIKF